MVGSPAHQLADPDHQQWPPHNAQICAAGAEAASTRPPRRTAAMRAAVNTWLITLCEAVHRPGASRARRPGTPTNRQGLWMLGTGRHDGVRQRVGAVCSAVVVPCAGGGQRNGARKTRSVGPCPDGQVDGPGQARRQRDGEHLLGHRCQRGHCTAAWCRAYGDERPRLRFLQRPIQRRRLFREAAGCRSPVGRLLVRLTAGCGPGAPLAGPAGAS